MENNFLRCSRENHKEIEAILFCSDCKIFICSKCEKYHSELFFNHSQIKIVKKNNQDFFTGICPEKNHLNELKFFCRNHNKLCCITCISKIKNKDIGQHSDCKICFIEDIEDEKKKQLENNLKLLEDLSNNLEKSLNELKLSVNKINENKEIIKKNIQQIFTKIRNEINNKEDKLLEEVDKKYDEIFLDENTIKIAEKLPLKISLSLEKGKLINKEWNKYKKNILINDCLNIENNIITINKIKDKIQNNNNLENIIEFNYENNEINNLIEKISNLGKIIDNNNKILFESKIEFDQKLVKDWLNNKNFKAELLFRKTRDGSKPKDFHERCDNKGITITFIETEKGYKFGGYTELQWNSKGKFQKDKSTFIFSFNNREKYLPRNNNDSIYCGSNYGPVFGCSQADIALGSDSLEKGQCYKDKTNTFLSDRILTNGDEFWDVKEIEVYKITCI